MPEFKLIEIFGGLAPYCLWAIAQEATRAGRQCRSKPPVSRQGSKVGFGILNVDLRHEYPDCMASVTLAILTLQFTPLEYRHHIMRRIYDHTTAGGAVILVEKVMGSTAEWDQLLTDEYLAFKGQSHYTQEQIARKRLALEGVLVPLTAEWNESLIENAGFAKPECFWRHLNFAGWVARKADV